MEDNEEIRTYLNDIFRPEYKIILHENGADALAQIRTDMPDLVLSDYQMPVMDGVQMCKKIKTDLLTSHIPVVILSAYQEVEDQLKGLEVGADDYIGKPFNKQILLQKINNIVESRRRLIRAFQTNNEFHLTQLEKPEQRFLEHLNQLIVKETGNENLDVAFLCEKLKISKTTLNLKLRSMLDISTSEYIKKVRLKEAFRLITEEGLNATEAASAIGFSISYFNTCFKKEFGMTPGKV